MVFKKRGVLFMGIVLSLVLTLSFISAGFTVGNLSHSVGTSYGKGQTITGWINISLNNEPANSAFTGSSGGSITLLSLLGLNPDYDYSCLPSDCEKAYSGSNPEATKTFNLGDSASKIIGIKLTGQVSAISSIEFEIASNAGASCNNQLKLDFLADGTTEIGNNKTTSETCSTNYGCYVTGGATEEYSIGLTPYCQKINLSESPSFNIGAWVKKVSGDMTLRMKIYDSQGSPVAGGECLLPAASASGGEISCTANYATTKQEEYYVCINSNTGSGVYKIKGSVTPSVKCGMYQIPYQDASLNAAYDIFAVGKKFNSVGTLTIKNILPDATNLGLTAQNYIADRYPQNSIYVNCTDGCVVPFEIISKTSQTITVKNLVVNYQKESGAVTSNDFYDVTEMPVKINSDFQKLKIDNANFSVPNSYGNATFELKLAGGSIFSEKISVAKIPIIKDIDPYETVAGVPTEFTLNVEQGEKNITSYSWDFGDNQTKITTTTNSTIHIYKNVSVYEMEVSATDSAGLSSTKTFSINVSSPKDFVETKLNDSLENLRNIKTEIGNLPSAYQTKVKNILNLNTAESELTAIQSELASGDTTEEQYINFTSVLLGITLPEEISMTKFTEALPFVPKENVIDIATAKEIAGGEYDSAQEENYIKGLYAWNKQYLRTTIRLQEVLALSPAGLNTLLSSVELDISQTTNTDANYYFIISKLEGFEVLGSDTPLEKRDYFYFPISTSDEKIAFLTTAPIQFPNLPAFISPSLTEIPTGNEIIEEPFVKMWMIITLLVILVLIILFGIYISIQLWYKLKYERFLFGNRNDLFNLYNFISNSKAKEKPDSQILSELKKAGWSSSQIKYAMKKFSGEKVGLPELPIQWMEGFFKKKPTQEFYRVPPNPTMGFPENNPFGYRKV